MTASAEAAPSPGEARRLVMVAICAVVIAAAVVCFNLLYLFVPAGMSPPQGFAPDIGAAYERIVPLPHFIFSPRIFTRISLGLQAAMWAAFFTATYQLSRLAGGGSERAAFKLVTAGSV